MYHKSGINQPQGGYRSAARAGEVLKVIDLVPASAASPTQDNLRTFLLLETHCDAFKDQLTVVPDRSPSRLAVLLARQGVEVGR